MFGFNFDHMLNTYEAEIQIYVGNELSQSNKLEAPRIMIEQQYLSLLQQIINDKSKPLSIKLLIKQDIYDENDNFVRTLWNSVECSNYEKEYKDE